MFTLKERDRSKVKGLTKGADSARVANRAHALNLRDRGYTIIETADILELTPRTIINITTNYEELGLERALYDDPRTGRPEELDDGVKSKIVALVCSDPPEGFDRWTLELIKTKVEKEGIVDTVCKESIRLILKEHDIKPWQQKMWCVPELDDEFIKRMEDVLDVYARPYTSDKPMVCLDEKPIPLHDDKREALAMKPGKVKRVDCEYKRNGTANTFCAIEPKSGVYINRVTENRSGKEFAKFLASIERRYSEAKKIVLIMDNLNTHKERSLIDFYGDEEGHRIWKRFEVHYTPKHGSWLNQAEIAIGMYQRQCLGNTRIGDIDLLRKKTNAWNRIINRKNTTINWKFSKKDAREKFNYG